MKYVVERMWMVVGNNTIDAHSPHEAAARVEDLPVPEEAELVEGTERVVNVYLVT